MEENIKEITSNTETISAEAVQTENVPDEAVSVEVQTENLSNEISPVETPAENLNNETLSVETPAENLNNETLSAEAQAENTIEETVPQQISTEKSTKPKKPKAKKPKKVKYSIEVTDLVISYRNLKKTSIKKNFFSFRKRTVERFVAVKGISFSVKEGEILGIIGKNGSGKSTTLNALAGIFSPDSGTIDLKGHSISLLSIGVGFQKEMTGRENIFLSGMLLGFSEAEIKAKAEEIIEFSELGDFIDMPVRTYSSGMHSKLAFSITAILETDIMLIDEVLSVGDQKFKKKSYDKMKSLISDKSRTVVIVSHNISTLLKLCDKVMWMHEGEIKKIGKPKKILQEYVEFMEEA